MGWNGSGVYSLPALYFPEAPGNLVDSDRYNGTLNDIATGLNVALTKNGQNSATANLPMGGFKHTGASPASSSGEYLTWGQAATVGAYTFTSTITVAGLATFNTTINVAGASRLGYLASADTAVYDGVTVANYGLTIGAVFGTYAPSSGLAVKGIGGLHFLSNSGFSIMDPSGNWGFQQTPSTGTRVGLTATGTQIGLSISQDDETGNVAVIRTGNSNASDATQFCVFHSGENLRLGNGRNNGSLAFLTNGVSRVTISASGAMSMAGDFSAGNVLSGTYTPTVANQSNITAVTPQPAMWSRVGNVVTVSGEVAIQPASAASAVFSLSLPYAVLGVLGETYKVAGTFNVPSADVQGRVRGSGLAATQVAWFQETYPGTSNYTCGYIFQFLIE